jgi:hypothetical protein
MSCSIVHRTLTFSISDAYIVFMGILALVVLYPAGNLKAVDAYFFGASASTESGLNTFVVTVISGSHSSCCINGGV